jgi:hypothetical protein
MVRCWGCRREVADHHAQSGADAADEIELQKAAGAPAVLQILAEHPQHQHVEEDVAEPERVVQEHVGEQLPDGKRSDNLGGNESEVLKKPPIPP